MKISRIFQFFYILVLMSCSPSNLIQQPTQTLTSEPPTLSVAPTQVITNTPVPLYKVIDKKNLNQLVLLYQWDVEGLYFYRSANFWFSDSNQFIVPNSGGVQSFKVDSFTPIWLLKSLNSDFTIDENDQVLINLRGLQIFNKQGVGIQTIRTNKFCDGEEPVSNYIAAIPGTNLVVTGHQDSSSDFGLNDSYDDKARLLIWDKSKNSCSELIKQFDGFLSSLSASYDGRYISYSVIIKTTNPAKAVTHLYNLDLQKETCELVGTSSMFNRQNQLAVYNPREKIISLITPSDCMTQIKFNVGAEVINAFTINPSGELLAGITSNKIRLWDVQTGEKLREIDPEGHILSIIGFSPDGHFLITAKRADSLAEKDKVMLWGIP